MGTSYDVLYAAFFRRVEEDRDFFQYINLSNDESMNLAKIRALGFLHEACARLAFDCPEGSDFLDYDDESFEFGFDLTKKEVHLVASLMYENYLNRDIAKLKCLSVNFTSTDLRVFDPSNARKTFMDMYLAVKAENDYMVDTYRCTDAEGAYYGIDFQSYDDE